LIGTGQGPKNYIAIMSAIGPSGHDGLRRTRPPTTSARFLLSQFLLANYQTGPQLPAPSWHDGAGCRLTIHWLDTVALGSEPIVHLFFKSRKVLGPVRGK
jgi:hypothetical protein